MGWYAGYTGFVRTEAECAKKNKVVDSKISGSCGRGLRLHYSRSHTPIMIPNYNLLCVVSVEY